MSRGRGIVPSLLAAALLASSSSLGATGVNLIVNPGAESAPGSSGGYDIVTAPGWTSIGDPTVIAWTASGGFPVAADPGPPNRGVNLFTGGPNSGQTSFTQVVSIADLSALLDQGDVPFTLSGYLGGYATQDDNARCTVEFLNSEGASLAASTIGPVLSLERQGHTGLLLKQSSGTAPTGSRSVRVTLLFTRVAGAYNDGYADELSLVLSPPASCPGDFNNDGVVSTPDLVVFLGVFGQSVAPGTHQDFNADGVISTPDLVTFLGVFGSACP